LKNIGKIIFDKFLNVLYAKENEDENKVSPKKKIIIIIIKVRVSLVKGIFFKY
jgi:hypothetical protein